MRPQEVLELNGDALTSLFVILGIAVMVGGLVARLVRLALSVAVLALILYSMHALGLF